MQFPSLIGRRCPAFACSLALGLAIVAFMQSEVARAAVQAAGHHIAVPGVLRSHRGIGYHHASVQIANAQQGLMAMTAPGGATAASTIFGIPGISLPGGLLGSPGTNSGSTFAYGTMTVG